MNAALQSTEEHSATGLRSWAARRTWTRTDTARWLDDRSAAVLGVLRRRPGQWPAHAQQAGQWLRAHARPLFDRAHGRLAAAPVGERETLGTFTILR